MNDNYVYIISDSEKYCERTNDLVCKLYDFIYSM